MSRPSPDPEPVPAAASSSAPGERAGDVIDRYELIEEVGEGGMGSVWRAHQSEPVKRDVALKIIKLGMDTKEVVVRFEAERQALALMDHPHIAKVLDGGATDGGRLYFVMELVDGVPITEYCDRGKLGVRERLELFAKVCEGIQHAHQKGLIHRDIKPGNVLVALQDGKPVPKVIDFGIAKATGASLTEKTMHTELGQMLGTPEYMAPEQLGMSGLDIDTRADVYSLGVLLYELLTGSKPFDIKKIIASGYDELLRTIREVDPEKPSTRISKLGDTAMIAELRQLDVRALGKQLSGDLDWVVMKSLEKDRARRYETANGFAADVRRFLKQEPVAAAPPSATYRLRKFVKRRKKTVAALTTIAVLLVAGSVGTGIGLWRTTQANTKLGIALGEKDLALKEEERQRTLAQENEARAKDAEQDARTEATRATLAEGKAEARSAELAQVAAFQSSQLSELNPELMGVRLRRSLIDAAPEDRRAALSAQLAGLNFTNLAMQSLEENLFERTIEAIEAQFTEQPLVQAQLFETVALTLNTLGLDDLAIDPGQRALSIRRAKLGDEHPDTLSSIISVGNLLHNQGRDDEAELYIIEAHESSRRVLGDDHSITIASIASMATLLDGQGQPHDAERYLQEALAGRRRVFGNEHPETLITIMDMGTLLMALGRLDEAELLVLEALDGFRRVLSDEHPITLEAISTMGLLRGTQERLGEAEPYYREALDGRRRVLGDEHPETLRSISDLGNQLSSLGRRGEARLYLQEALGGRRRLLGDEHPDTLLSINALGLFLFNNGELDEAEPYLRDSLAVRRRVLGDEHPDTLGSIDDWGLLLHAKGQLDEAEPYLREAVDGKRRVLGGEHPDTLDSIHYIGALFRTMGRYDKAERYLREALDGRRRLLGDEHPETLQTISSMGFLFRAQGRHGEAEPFFREALDGRRRALGDEHPLTLRSISLVAILLQAQGRFDEAEPYYREALDGRRRVLGDEHPDTLASINNVGTLLQTQGRLNEAEPYYREALDTKRRVLGDEHQSTVLAINNVVALLQAKVSAARQQADEGDLASALADLGAIQLLQRADAAAELALAEAFEILSGVGAEESQLQLVLGDLGAAVAAQGRHADAEPMLGESAEWMLDNPTHPAAGTALQRMVDLYDAWNAAEPGQGHDEVAAEWRGELEAWRAE